MLTKPDTEEAAGLPVREVDASLIDALLTAPTGQDEPEVARLRLKVLELTARNERLRDTVAYQLGSAIVAALKSPREFFGLPVAVWRIYGLSKTRRGLTNGERAVSLDGESARRLLRLTAVAPDLSADDIIAVAARECRDSRLVVQLLSDLTRSLKTMDFAKALALGRHVYTLDSTPRRAVWLADLMFEGGMIDEPNALYRLTDNEYGLNAGQRRRREQARGLADIRARGVLIPPRTAPRAAADLSVVYVASTSLPHHTSGYAARTHSILKAIQGSGVRLEAVTRPGYPLDRTDARENSGRQQPYSQDGVTYERLPGPPVNSTALPEFIQRASESIRKHIERTRPAVVHAASNYVNALPALIAARQAGLPFIYEVRGLWELTSSAKNAAWYGSERFELDRDLEIVTAREADAVIAISGTLKDELVSRGIDPDKIVIAPNSVDIERFTPLPRDMTLAEKYEIGDRKVLGYIGSLTVYEGLTDLVAAVARLRGQGLDVCAVIVGDGPVFAEVQEAARRLDVMDHVIMPGRVPPSEVSRWYSIFDVAVYPRRPMRVTEVVPPLKPLEAMAMELPVVASDVAAISETVCEERNGFLFRKGDIDSLVEVLTGVLADPDGATAMGRAARKDVQARFAWSEVARRLNTLYTSHARIQG